ncbi:MAG: TIM barrel protein [Phycisphaeraceae bacterium]
MSDNKGYRFSFGPWNLSDGADVFGPAVRPPIALAETLKVYKDLGFDALMLHDDDAVPELEQLSAAQAFEQAKQFRQRVEGEGLVVELAAPRLWEDPRGIDGPLTANDAKVRQWGIDRSRRCADLCQALGTDLMVLWLAREGTYCREAKHAIDAHHWLVEAINAVLEHDPAIRIAIEPKPNEPMDHAYIPSIGHALELGRRTVDPSRVGGLIESAHSILAGFDPSDDMAFALAAEKLWSVHLNDQNGLKFDQDKAFGATDLRRAFNQVRVLELAGYREKGMVAFDTKAMRTSKPEHQARHLDNSKRTFLHLVDKVRSWDVPQEQRFIADRDYEGLEMAILEHLMGVD